MAVIHYRLVLCAFVTLSLLTYRYKYKYYLYNPTWYWYQYIRVSKYQHDRAPVSEVSFVNVPAVDAEILSKFPRDARRDAADATRRIKRCRSTLNNSEFLGRGAEVFRYLHIPKTGGANIEKFLQLKHQTHRRLALQKVKDGTNLLLTIRHPIERLQSLYYFIKAGNSQTPFRRRQSYFCANETGKATNTECIPKQSFFEFAMSEIEPDPFENVMLQTTPRLIPEVSEGVGSVANFQTKWLLALGRPETLRQVQERLLNFTLVGDTSNLHEFKYMLARVWYGDSDAKARRRTCNSTAVVNKTPHVSIGSDLSEEQYRLVAERNSADIRLYYWILDQMAAQRACFGLDDSPLSCTN